MADLEFDRAAVGVNAKTDWTDSEEFAQIGSFAGQIDVSNVAQNLPKGPNEGVTALRTAANEFRSDLRDVALEFSDACAVLGSGQETAISNNDATESANTAQFRRETEQRFPELTERMEG